MQGRVAEPSPLPLARYYLEGDDMAVNAHRCRNARPPYAHDFMLYDIGDGETYPFVAMMACRKCGEIRKAQEEATPPVALDDVIGSIAPAPKIVRPQRKRPTRKSK